MSSNTNLETWNCIKLIFMEEWSSLLCLKHAVQKHKSSKNSFNLRVKNYWLSSFLKNTENDHFQLQILLKTKIPEKIEIFWNFCALLLLMCLLGSTLLKLQLDNLSASLSHPSQGQKIVKMYDFLTWWKLCHKFPLNQLFKF